jgi:hypothetical protein
MTEYDRLSGGKCGIYCSPGFLGFFGDWFKNRDLWLAWYNRSLTKAQILAKVAGYKWTGKVNIWQYASDGDINNDCIADGLTLGMETAALDLNVYLGTLAEWSAWAGTTPSSIVVPVEDQPIPVVLPTGRTKVVGLLNVSCTSGLNIRNVPKGVAGSIVTGWLANGKEVEILENIAIGTDTWARIGQGQVAAIKYQSTTFMV